MGVVTGKDVGFGDGDESDRDARPALAVFSHTSSHHGCFGIAGTDRSPPDAPAVGEA